MPEGQRELIIVCPTSRGGHLEHSLEIAKAMSGFTHKTVVSRRGAKAYSEGFVLGDVQIVESMPPLVDKRESISGRIRMVFNLILEMGRLFKLANQHRGSQKVFLLQEARYPGTFFLKGRSRENIIGLFVHNVEPHGGWPHGLTGKVLRFLETRSRKAADLLICHGKVQLDALRRRGYPEILELALPGQNTLRPQVNKILETLNVDYLCIGEIRSNKGLEVAIAAFERVVNRRLLIAGNVIDSEYFRSLKELANGLPNVEIEPEFLGDEQFELLIANARTVLLPYTEFPAQSGVLAKCMHFGKHVVASALPALMEQAGDYGNIRFFEVGNSESLALEVSRTAHSPRTAAKGTNASSWAEECKLLSRRLGEIAHENTL